MAFIRCSDGSICRDTCDLSLSEQVAKLEKQLADAKAKLAAEQKPKTKGETLAEDYIFSDGCSWGPSTDYDLYCEVEEPNDGDRDGARKHLARIIDSAIADAKAEQRESCIAELRRKKTRNLYFEDAILALESM